MLKLRKAAAGAGGEFFWFGCSSKLSSAIHGDHAQQPPELLLVLGGNMCRGEKIPDGCRLTRTLCLRAEADLEWCAGKSR